MFSAIEATGRPYIVPWLSFPSTLRHQAVRDGEGRARKAVGYR
jgi:hypothetical protein